ncbi:hypothetical protein D3C86_1001020 [compost metagenome]
MHGDEAGGGKAQGDDPQQRVAEGHRAGDPGGGHEQGQARGAAAFAGAVAVAGNQVGGDQCADPRDCRHQADHQPDLGPQQSANLTRQIKHHAVDAGLDQQVDQAQVQHRGLADHVEQAAAVVLFMAVFLIEQALHLLAFLDGQPLGIGRTVVQVPVGPDAHRRGHQAFNGKQPLPAVEAGEAVQFQQQAGQRTAEDERQRRTEIEETHGLAAHGAGKPVGEVEDHAGEEAGFGHAQQKAQDVEAGFSVGEDHGGGDQAPGDHDPAHPQAGADAVQDQVARHFKQRVAHEEHPGAEGEGGIADVGVGLKGLLGEPDVGAVEEGHDVHQQEKRE